MLQPIRVIIADDHTLVREGLRLLLDAQPDFQVAAEAADGLAAVRLTAEHSPDLVLLDARMPEMDGIQALEQIHCQFPAIKVLILSMYDDEDLFFRALRLGASGYILKGASSVELIEALRIVARGQTYLSPTLAGLLVDDFRKGWRFLPCGDEPAPEAVLSTREQEVLQRLAQGQTNSEIAAALVISSSTVQTHRSRILEKLGLKSRSDVVKYALRHGLIELK